MINVIIRETQNPAILKFEFPDFIANHVSYEFKNIDEASVSPLAQKLFHLPFVKAVYISGNFIAIERYNIVEWEDVQEAVADQINEFVNTGGKVLNAPEQASQKMPATVYGETTPNPSVLKFVVSRGLTKTAWNIKASTTLPLHH